MTPPAAVPDPPSRVAAVGIAASTGSPQWVEHVLKGLPADLPTPVFVALHLPPAFTDSFAKTVAHQAAITVVEAEHGMPVLPGTAYIGKGRQHLRVMRTPGAGRDIVEVGPEPAELLYKPSGDELLRSMAEVYGRGALGVVMSGIGQDGLIGARAVKAAGGSIWTQTAETCAVYGMPKACDEAGLSDRSVSPEQVRAGLAALTTKPV